ncbi:MAG: serine hydrolase domain-containing protein [Actinocatenispora sp.]
MGQGKVWCRGVAAALAGLVALGVPGAASARQEPDRATVRKVVADFAHAHGYPGIAVTVTKGRRVWDVDGYGRDSAGAAITATTPMPVESVSKSFTALAVMQLVDSGRVTLDAPVRRYLPGFRVADPRGSRITVRELLNHTSGITDGTLPEKSLPQPDSLAGVVVRARQATLASAPGTRFGYTNTNYHLAARVVELVSGEPFGEYLRRHVFGPLGMRATTSITMTPRDIPRGMREGHIYAYGASVRAREPNRFVSGSDGVITTARDMAQWLIMQNNGGLGANGTRVVSAGSIAAMHRVDRRIDYGLGWEAGHHGRVRHEGIWFTYTAGEMLLPDGYGIAVSGNSGMGLGNEGVAQLVDDLATVLDGGTPDAPTPVRLIVDLVVAALTMMSLLLGVRALLRTRRWVDRSAARPVWRALVRLLVRLARILLWLALPDALTYAIGGGRDLTHLQMAYYSPALVAWVLVALAMNVAVLGARGVGLWRARLPVPDAPTRDVLRHPAAL